MKKFQVFLTTMYGSFIKVFITAVLVFIVKNKGIEGLKIEQVINSGLVAILPVIINFINPEDQRYGIGSSDSQPMVDSKP